jgi:hypothetical protein
MLKNNYKIFYCKIHKIYIHYFLSNEKNNGYQCWDCVRDGVKLELFVEPKKEKENE